MSSITAFVSVLCLLASGVPSAIDVKAPLVREEVEALLGAPDLVALDRIYDAFGPTDIATRIVYVTKRLAFEPGDRNELMLIGTIPDTPLQYSLFYALTNPTIFGDEYQAERSDVFYGYFERVARSVARHRTGAHAFLGLVIMTDGEVKEISHDWYEWLADSRPRLVREALKSFSENSRRLLCGDECAQLMRTEEE
jgi:hypothetical protein